MALYQKYDPATGKEYAGTIDPSDIPASAEPSNTKFVSPGFTGLSDPYYTTIAGAIAAATSGDMIHIYIGTYSETLSVQKTLNFYAEDGAILNCSTSGGFIIQNSLEIITVNITGNLSIINNDSGYSIYVYNDAIVNIDIKNHYKVSGVSTPTMAFNECGTIRLNVQEYFDGVLVSYAQDIRLSGGDYDLIYTYSNAGETSNLSGTIRSCTLISATDIVSLTIKEMTIISGNPITINASADVTIRDCKITYSATGRIIGIGAAYDPDAQLRLVHCHVSATNASADLIELQKGNVILDNCTLVTAGTNCVIHSLTAGSGEIINYGSVSNKIANASITQRVENILVDTNVI